MCVSMSIRTGIDDGVHHETDSLVACIYASQVVRCGRLDKSTAAGLASRTIDRQCLERGKVRRVRGCRVASAVCANILGGWRPGR